MPNPEARLPSLSLLLAFATCLPLGAQERRDPDTTSKNPPLGAPWQRDFFAARDAAIARGVPIFVYSTKTY